MGHHRALLWNGLYFVTNTSNFKLKCVIMFLKRFYFQAKIPSRSGILGSKDQGTLNIHEYATRHKEFYIWQSIVVVVLYLVHYDDTLLQNMSKFFITKCVSYFKCEDFIVVSYCLLALLLKLNKICCSSSLKYLI